MTCNRECGKPSLRKKHVIAKQANITNAAAYEEIETTDSPITAASAIQHAADAMMRRIDTMHATCNFVGTGTGVIVAIVLVERCSRFMVGENQKVHSRKLERHSMDT